MQLLCSFDLPVKTTKNRREYRKFRKFLLKNGFIMLQESLYTRMVIGGNTQASMEDLISRNKPPEGSVMLLAVTERQFANMKILVGEYNCNVIVNSNRVIEV